MMSHRVADNRLEPIKEDLQLALRRIQFDLDAWSEDPRDPTFLEAIAEAIDQIRGALATLGHQEAVAFLEEVRAWIQNGVANQGRTFDPTLARQATEQLMSYLEVSLSPGDQRPDADQVFNGRSHKRGWFAKNLD